MIIEDKQSHSLTGMVISDVREATITVKIEWSIPHPKYGKIVKRFTKLHVHDQNNEAKIGQRVRIQECRPISKTKAWKLLEILS